ncbi:RNA polymerase sigma-70 factor [Flavobacteriaceae bacterium F08102]|nr:RNA polymerase sigma-70 factor [Flavobacteriaceae bacterium F08102]
MNTNERNLIEKLHRDDEQALRLLYLHYWSQLYQAAINLVKEKEIAEDIVQDVFINLWQKRAQLEIKTSLKNYLYTSTIYKVYDYFRKNKNAKNLDQLEDFHTVLQLENPESSMMTEELIEFIYGEIDKLPAKCKEVFLLSRDLQLSNSEIALKLNISKRTVEGHISKALAILRLKLGHIVSLEVAVLLLNSIK